MEVKKDILWRVYLCFIGLVLLSVLVLGRAMYIQTVQGAFWRAKSDTLHTQWKQMEAERGTIYSEEGNMLSTSIPFFDIYIDFGADGLREKNGARFKEYVDSLSRALADYFGDKRAAQYKNELLAGYRDRDRYYELKTNLTFEQYKMLRTFPLVNQGRNKSGFIAEVHHKRLNPFGLLANRAVGLSRQYRDSQNHLISQNVGLEKTYDSLLMGENGHRQVRYISGGAFIPVEGTEIEPENGKDIITTLDVNIQDISETALLKMMYQNQAEHGTCIVMEVATGKIKAMANLGLRPDGSYWEDYNYGLRATEPGSTIKLVTLLSVLSEGKASINDPVEVGSAGREIVGPRNVNEAERMPKPVLTLRECFAHSSNVGMSKVAYQTFADNPTKFTDYIHKFHMDRRTGIDLIGEERPLVPSLKGNKEGLHMMVTMAFGYGIQVTPLQTLMLYNAVANDGRMMRPYLVNRIQSGGQVVRQFEPEVAVEKIADPEIIRAAQQCMLSVTEEGTGKVAFQNALYKVGGKTGTANVAARGLSYDDGVYQASFVGYFPFEKPRYSCIVVIKTKAHPAFHFGGAVSAPVFREIADKLFALNSTSGSQADIAGLKKDSTLYYYAGQTGDFRKILGTLGMAYQDSARQQPWGSLYSNNQQPVINGRIPAKNSMPNIRGMGLKDALYQLEALQLKVTVQGKGKVVAQSINPGEPLQARQPITIELN